jgi:hypothetical protein
MRGQRTVQYHLGMRRAETFADRQVIQAVEAIWKHISPSVPAEFFLTSGANSSCGSVNWDDRPLPIRLNLRQNGPGQNLPLTLPPGVAATQANLRSEGRRSPEDLLLHLLHMAAHANATTPSGGSEGRYHGVGFLQAAKRLGVETMMRGDRDRWSAGTGFAFDFSLYDDPNSESWQELRRPKWYRRDLERLRVIEQWEDTETGGPRGRRGAISLRCQCTEQTILAGLKARGLPPNTGTGRSSSIAAPKIISVSQGVQERGGLRCDDCGQTFEPY